MPRQQIFPHGTHTTEGVQVHERTTSTRTHMISSVVSVRHIRVHLRVWALDVDGQYRLEVPLTLRESYRSMHRMMRDVHRYTPVSHAQVLVHIGHTFTGMPVIDSFGRMHWDVTNRETTAALLSTYRRAILETPMHAMHPLLDAFVKVDA